MWGAAEPRLDPPLHAGQGKTDPLGGVSMAVFPLPQPAGAHVFSIPPGTMTDTVRDAAHCSGACSDSLPATDLCSCKAPIYDIGSFMFNMVGRWMHNGGASVNLDLCNATNTCADIPAAPEARPASDLDQ